ncbi:MAG: hypothetical protein EXS47_01290 [Candidatus Zambryskibacteria bacterium]|nr:hypothetical protein [Candidatus Zambryskibacteria bacterium]
MFVVKRSKLNPILTPEKDHSFESFSTFNGSPIEVGKNIHLLYRAHSLPETFENNHFSLSVIGKAVSSDGLNFSKREQFIFPENPWERYGLEDPRVTKLQGKYYIFYTALSVYPFAGDGIKVGLAISRDMKTIESKHQITPFNAKAMTLFPEKINGKFVAILSVNTDRPPSRIAIAEFEKVEDMWDPKYWNKWYKNLDKYVLNIPKLDSDQVEVGATPIRTKDGWLMIYSHIKNYYSDNKIFGIEGLLLDLKNPQKIVGSTRSPLLVPEESYEKYGQAPNIVFPSGALVKEGKLLIYYGATDTTCAVAEVPLAPLLLSMKLPRIEVGFKRLTEGPILVPDCSLPWQSRAVFNPTSIFLAGSFHILYRAMSKDNTSVVGYAQSKDGTNITYKSLVPIYKPREDFERKGVPNGNSGCEDPRLTIIGDRIYMCYTAYNGITPPSVAMTSISSANFLKKEWKWTKPILVTRDGVDDKDGCLHPEKVNGKYLLYHRVNSKICADYGSTLSFKERNNFRDIPILGPRHGMWDSKKVGLSSPPIKTKYGWLMLYHGVSEDSVYRIGAILLDLKDPTKVLARTTDYIFEPVLNYEKVGQINNVVFPCGATLKGDTIFMYYGAGDSVLDVASIKLKDLLQSLIF